jgi:hypothetical protein
MPLIDKTINKTIIKSDQLNDCLLTFYHQPNTSVIHYQLYLL